ncbi:conjugative transfer system coupling protein TraD [Halomonas sp. 86]|uniref:conjugative transfer system coupling protein TraD n=1 Tax=unclassified Halomonas TaxID=2609666 RepID=UPI004033B0CA
MSEDISYEMPWRSNYEAMAIAGWCVSGVAAYGINHLASLPPEPFYYMGGICVTMAVARIPKAIKLHTLQKHLSGRELEFITFKKLLKNLNKKPDYLWLGTGFYWESRHAQRAFEILKRDWSSIVNADGKLEQTMKKLSGKEKAPPIGHTWIHGLEPKEITLRQPIGHSESHTLIVGTTGSGKTRYFDLQISQAIARGECVIILDPKGDREMRDNARRACEKLGTPERFIQFHPGFPSESVRINPLRNFSRLTEIPSRIANLIPTEGGGDVFQSFGWQALNNFSQGLGIINQRPTLKNLRSLMEGGADGLVIEAISTYSEKHIEDWQSLAAPYLEKAAGGPRQKRARLLCHFYSEVVKPKKPSSELEGLISMFLHDAAHFGKMVASLLPILNMLTSGDLGELLSPDPYNMTDERPIMDSEKIINNAMVCYVGLDSLTDNMVASAIGSIFLSDLTAVAGKRYNYGENLKPINLFVDEAAECINDPMIQLLNKGRGALFRLFVATQTYADFVARLGSKDKASQVLGNINNTIALRVKDTETQEFITAGLPPTRVKYVMRTQGQNTLADQPIMHGGNQGERLMEEESELFPAALLGMLPNLEFVANISGGQFVKGRIPILTA